MFYTARRSGLRGRKLVYIAATATYTAPTRVFGIFARCTRNGTQIYVHFTPDLRILTQPYATVRLLYAILRVGTPIFIPHKYAVPMHKVRNHTQSYANLRRSCDFFMRTQPEYAGVRG